MEDLKAYLESGILELYVLGELSDAEKREVELMAVKYPEIQAELADIEKALFQYAEANAVAPKATNRSKILQSLETEPAKETPVVPISSPSNQTNFYKVAFAASLALLLVSILGIISLSKKLRDSYDQIAVLESSNQKYSNQVNQKNDELTEVRRALGVYQNREDYQLVTLKGTPKAPESSMVVAFNASKEEVFIDLSSLQMPNTDKEHQYQLWALVDGKPVDLGVFDYSEQSALKMKEMKSIGRAQAFAVTLEPKGGSPSPTLEQMMAMGTL